MNMIVMCCTSFKLMAPVLCNFNTFSFSVVKIYYGDGRCNEHFEFIFALSSNAGANLFLSSNKYLRSVIKIMFYAIIRRFDIKFSYILCITFIRCLKRIPLRRNFSLSQRLFTWTRQFQLK